MSCPTAHCPESEGQPKLAENAIFYSMNGRAPWWISSAFSVANPSKQGSLFNDALQKRLEAVTGERISSLKGIGEIVEPEREKEERALPGVDQPGPEAFERTLSAGEIGPEVFRDKAAAPEKRT